MCVFLEIRGKSWKFPQWFSCWEWKIPVIDVSVFISGQKVLITEDLEDVTVLEGESAMFKCRISPIEYSKVQWFLDKTPLHTNELNDIQSQPGGYHLLTLKKLSLKDSGLITFEAGDKKTSASLVVKGNSSIKNCRREENA